MDGGSGVDTLDYSTSTAGVSVNLIANVVLASGGDALGDTISGFENLIGTAFSDGVVGSATANVLSGGAGNDTILASGGNDVIAGGADNDFLDGGLGIDQLIGGQGRDTFDFDSTADSKVGLGNRDLIDGFAETADKIDLSEIDGNTGAAGFQQLAFIGTQGFFAPGQVRVFLEGGDTVVAVNTTGNSGTEMEIQFADQENLVAADFIF
jgi:Ca2+-binding RTX toxin-like protein